MAPTCTWPPTSTTSSPPSTAPPLVPCPIRPASRTSASTGCAGNAEGLNGAKAIAISPDGANVYVASITDNSIVSVDRAPDGTLSNPSCIKNLGGPQACADSAEGLEDARGVTTSDDGASVIVASGDDSALANFDRAADGSLSSLECVADVGSPAACGDNAQGLENAQEVAISPDGTAVYAVSSTDSAVVRLARDAPPVCEPSSSTGMSGEQQVVPLSCSDIDGDPGHDRVRLGTGAWRPRGNRSGR